MIKKLLTSALFLVLAAQPRQACAFDLGFVGGFHSANQGIAETTWGSDAAAKASFVFGALLNFSVLPAFSVELGGFYATHKTGTLLGFDQTKNLVFPLLARFWVLPILSLGAGPFFARGIGDFKHIDTPSTGIPIETSYSPAEGLDPYELKNYSKNDLGAAFSVNLSFPMAPGLNVLGDIRYYYGLTDRNTSGVGAPYKTTMAQFLAGIQFTY